MRRGDDCLTTFLSGAVFLAAVLLILVLVGSCLAGTD